MEELVNITDITKIISPLSPEIAGSLTNLIFILKTVGIIAIIFFSRKYFDLF